MTVIINAIWGERVIQVVDRQISRRASRAVEVVDLASTKVCVVRCSNALLSIAYTGVAVVKLEWMDSVLAGCLAHRRLEAAIIQPGTPWLGRSAHMVIDELAINLNGQLNSDPRASGLDLQVSVVGWHFGRTLRPLSWELKRGPAEPNGMRYFTVKRHPVGRFLRRNPRRRWIETFGNPGLTVDDRMRELAGMAGYSHDDVERHAVAAIVARAAETTTVGDACLAVQLDPRDSNGQVQFTNYPGRVTTGAADAHSFVTGWVLTPRLISSPGTESTAGRTFSLCGQYLVGGFSDGNTNLHVRTRIAAEHVHYGGRLLMAYGTQTRVPTV